MLIYIFNLLSLEFLFYLSIAHLVLSRRHQGQKGKKVKGQVVLLLMFERALL